MATIRFYIKNPVLVSVSNLVSKKQIRLEAPKVFPT